MRGSCRTPTLCYQNQKMKKKTQNRYEITFGLCYNQDAKLENNNMGFGFHSSCSVKNMNPCPLISNVQM